MIRTKGLPRSVALFSSLFLIVSLAVAKDAGQTTTTPPRLVTLDDMNTVKWPGAPRLSADGKQVAYAVDGQIYVVATAGGEPTSP